MIVCMKSRIYSDAILAGNVYIDAIVAMEMAKGKGLTKLIISDSCFCKHHY